MRKFLTWCLMVESRYTRIRGRKLCARQSRVLQTLSSGKFRHTGYGGDFGKVGAGAIHQGDGNGLFDKLVIR